MNETAPATLPAIERVLQLKASPARVWRALTDSSELARWFPDRADIDFSPGATGTMFWEGHGEFAVVVDSVDPERYLAYRWANEPGPLTDATSLNLVEWWLERREDGGTTLRLRESGFTDAEARAGDDEGWTEELAELVDLLGG